MANEDNNEQYGVYRIVRELEDKRPAHGSKVYLMECTVCGALRELRKIDAIKVDSCKHICTGGRRSVKHGTWKNKRIAQIFHGMTYRCYKEDSNYQEHTYNSSFCRFLATCMEESFVEIMGSLLCKIPRVS